MLVALDNQTKAALVKSGFFELWDHAQKKAWYGHREEVHALTQFLTWEEMTCLDGLRESRRRRKKRALEKIEAMMPHNPIFVTLTFNDATLERTTPQQRRLLVVRYLKAHASQYLANIDFGKDNGREHYHVICVPKTGSMPRKPWERYGNPNFERLRHSKSPKAVSTYIIKFTHHAFKESTCQRGLPRLIYSRS